MLRIKFCSKKQTNPLPQKTQTTTRSSVQISCIMKPYFKPAEYCISYWDNQFVSLHITLHTELIVLENYVLKAQIAFISDNNQLKDHHCTSKGCFSSLLSSTHLYWTSPAILSPMHFTLVQFILLQLTSQSAVVFSTKVIFNHSTSF